jgi:hypothetical protein
MIDSEIYELAAPDDGGFHAPPRWASARARQIFRGIGSKSGALLLRLVKVLFLACVVALFLPALLMVGALCIVIARVLGVPLFATTPFPHRHR